ncbi:MAG: hypothetical protein IJ646_04385 [Clostridia bacterium]|nr:hypothetical protein [Clostridia bacterium]
MRVRGTRLAVSLLVLLAMAGLIYFGTYYRAGGAAVEAMTSSDDVTVTDAGRYIAFDGPGAGDAVAFYPGAKVEAEAYAPLMRLLAEGGADAYLLRMPARVALFDVGAAARPMADHPHGRWIVAGHSLGGVAACAFAGKHADVVDGVVLLASYPVSKLPEGLRLLSIFGSADGVLDMDRYDGNRSNWPPDAREIVLYGGNHAGFGDYGPQSGDGDADIPPEAQQAATARAILDFCKET